MPDETPAPSLPDVLRKVLPGHTHYASGGMFGLGQWSATWTTPDGTWKVEMPPALGIGVGLTVTGPGGRWTLTGDAATRIRRVLALLRALDAIGDGGDGA